MRQSKLSTTSIINTINNPIKHSISSQQNNLTHYQLSYNELLNHRSTLLHMQYLYSYMNQSLQKQHINQQNQHKDHLIQCFNMKQQLQELKKNNMMRLFIVKLEELLAIEEEPNKRLIQQDGVYQDKIINRIDNNVNVNNGDNQHQHQQQQQQQQQLKNNKILAQYTITPLIDKLLTYSTIKQQQMQHSLCKLYLGNKVMLDLQKTSNSIQIIQRKIEQFMTKNLNTIKKYNQRLQELDDCRDKCKQYMNQVKNKVVDSLNSNNNNDNNRDQTMTINNKHKLYEKHLLSKLKCQQQQIQLRIERLKHALLQFQ